MTTTGLPKSTGIYAIKNSINDKVYIGSAKNIHFRILNHRHSLFHLKHANKKLQNHVNKYGIETLFVEIIEIIKTPTPSLISKREQFFIDLLNPWFNICKKTYAYTKGPESYETIAKRAVSLRNVTNRKKVVNKRKDYITKEFLESLPQLWIKGQKFSDDFKRAMRIGRILFNNNIKTYEEAVSLKREILCMYKNNVSQIEIAKKTNRNQSTISRIISGKIWSDIII